MVDDRYQIPCAFGPVMPPGIHVLRDLKEQVCNHVKRLRLPYTIVDVGWWYQTSLKRLPSGKIDYAIPFPFERLASDGNTMSALIHVDDIGNYMANVLRDDRTLNKQVFVYTEMWSQNQICDCLDSLSGEKVSRKYESMQELQELLDSALPNMLRSEDLNNPENSPILLQVLSAQYLISWGIRGDNAPEYARYLGYLTSDELYPDFRGVGFERCLQEVIDGKAKSVYVDIAATFRAAMKEPAV